MPPKRRGKQTEFDPKSLGEEDRFTFNLNKKDDVAYKFFVFIIELRVFAAFGGKKLRGQKFQEKLCLGDANSYKNPYLLVSLFVEGKSEVQMLIYKPKVYSVAFFVQGSWYRVSDFSLATGQNFSDSKNLPYDSRYGNGCPTKFSFYVFLEAIMGVYNSGDNSAFRSLCVILCETMRSDVILKVITKSLGKDDEVRREVTLSVTHEEIIRNWSHTSGLWYVYDLGFDWDPLHSYTNLGVEDADECDKSLGLVMKMDFQFEHYIDRMRNLSYDDRMKAQRRGVNMKGFICEDEWNAWNALRV